MKNLTSILLSVLLVGNVYLIQAQESYERGVDSIPLIDYLERSPTFEGGEEALFRFIAENLRYPIVDRNTNLEGKVMVRFIIDREGNVTDPVVFKSVDPLLDAEALRVIRLLPKWNPGTLKGIPVSTYYALPITFKVEDKERVPKDVLYFSFLDSLSIVKFEIDESVEMPIDDDIPIFTIYPSLPTFVGGEETLMRYLADSMRYPTIDMGGIPDGKVVVRFTIDEEGNICEPEVIRSLHPLLDTEALRVVKSMPKWWPAKEFGKPVKSELLTLPIYFRLNEEDKK